VLKELCLLTDEKRYADLDLYERALETQNVNPDNTLSEADLQTLQRADEITRQ